MYTLLKLLQKLAGAFFSLSNTLYDFVAHSADRKIQKTYDFRDNMINAMEEAHTQQLKFIKTKAAERIAKYSTL